MDSRQAAASHQRILIWSGVVVVCCVPLAAWWLIGDLSVTDSTLQLDYLMRVPDEIEASTRYLGPVAAGATLVALFIFLRVLVTHDAARTWVWILLALGLAGVTTAWGGRIVTAGVIGANIGAGLAIFFLSPLVLLLVLFAVIRLRRVLERGPA